MIATLSAIVFIVSEKRDILGDRIIQKGQAISKISDDDYQLFNYTLFVPLHQESLSGSDSITVMDNDNETAQLVEPENLYLFHGKFSANADSSLEVAVTSNRQLSISHEDTPVSRPFIHLLGRTQSVPIKTKSGYQVVLQVKPYVSKQQCGPMNIVLVHSLEGRFKNALEKTTKLALVHVMGTLVEHEKTFYCDILEYQFIGIRPEEGSGINVPWKTQSVIQNNDKQQASSSTMSSVDKRIQAIHQDIQELPPESSGTKRGRTNASSKRQGKRTKVSDIAVELLTGKKTEEQQTRTDEPTTQDEQRDMHVEVAEDHADTMLEHVTNEGESDHETSHPKKKHNTRQKGRSDK